MRLCTSGDRPYRSLQRYGLQIRSTLAYPDFRILEKSNPDIVIRVLVYTVFTRCMHTQPCMWRLSSSCAFYLTFVIFWLITVTICCNLKGVAYFELMQFCNDKGGESRGREKGCKGVTMPTNIFVV